ncbi:MAG: ABC transporter substrate-binding protein, partial [bacterium]
RSWKAKSLSAWGSCSRLGACFMKRNFYCITLIIIVSFSYISCQRSQSGTDKSLTIGIETGPTNLDPRKSLDAISHKLTQLIFSSLVRIDESLNIVPDIAQSWESPDKQTYIFHLKRNVYYHNGVELTAEDVKYTFDSMLDPNFKSPKAATYEIIKEIHVLDPYAIKFSLKEPFAPFLTNMVMGIVPKDIATSEGKKFETHPVGSGPFKFERWLSDERVVLSGFDNYFAGKPKMDTLIFKIIPDDTVRIFELKKGSIDLIQNEIPPDMLTILKREAKFNIETAPGTNLSYLGFNLKDPILTNRLVREAIAHAINRKAIIEHILGGFAQPAKNLLSPACWAYEPDVQTYPYDPDRSRSLLDLTGYEDPDGEGPQARFTMTYKTSQNDLSKRIAEVIQDDLGKVGIKVDLRSLEWGTFFSDIKSGNFQVYSLQWVGITDPDIYYYLFHSQSIPPHGANRGHYISPQIDWLIEEGRVTLDNQKRKEIYSQIQKLLAKDLPYVNLWHWDNIVIMKKNISGYTLFPSADYISLKDTEIKK